jgi:hypothetical protein
MRTAFGTHGADDHLQAADEMGDEIVSADPSLLRTDATDIQLLV